MPPRQVVEVHVIVVAMGGGRGVLPERGDGFTIREGSTKEGRFREGLATQHAKVPANIITATITITKEGIVHIVRKRLSEISKIRMCVRWYIIEIGV